MSTMTSPRQKQSQLSGDTSKHHRSPRRTKKFPVKIPQQPPEIHSRQANDVENTTNSHRKLKTSRRHQLRPPKSRSTTNTWGLPWKRNFFFLSFPSETFTMYNSFVLKLLSRHYPAHTSDATTIGRKPKKRRLAKNLNSKHALILC
jgi:hypothetical protein